VKLHVVERSDVLTHVALEGDLDVEGVNAIEDAFYFNLTAPKKPAIVDMAGVKFISSLGMGMLVRVAQSLRRQGVRMVLLNLQGTIDESLRMTNIDQVIPFASSREEALERLR
jgi:anti-anti-sigma factor